MSYDSNFTLWEELQMLPWPLRLILLLCMVAWCVPYRASWEAFKGFVWAHIPSHLITLAENDEE